MIDIELLKSSYSEEKKKYSILGERLMTIINQILDKNKIHTITYRTKELESLIGKIISKDKYNELTDITDLCGIRIITNLESDIEYVSRIIRQTFKIDEPNSHDHRKRPVNEFGYLSLHLVISLDKDREDLIENFEIKSLKAEIQIRSILQHAWAEIEHDLGYKNKEDVPKELQRGSNRLAAILEAADLEFVRLSFLKLNHIHKASEAINSSVENNTQIDSININVLDSQNKTLKAVREMLRDKYGITFIKKGNYKNILDKLKFFGIKYLEQLEKDLNENKEVLIKFSNLLFQRRNDNRKYILYEAPLEYYLHFLGSAKGIEEWNNYRYGDSADCENTIKEVTDFLALHKDAISQ